MHAQFANLPNFSRERGIKCMSGVKSDFPSTLSPAQWSHTPKKSAKIEICQQSKLSVPNSSAVHCKDKIPKFRSKYSQKRNVGSQSQFPHSCVCEWFICIFPRSVCLFCWRKYVDQSWDYINRSQTHQCGNLGWGRPIPRKGIHKWDFHCSVPYTHMMKV